MFVKAEYAEPPVGGSCAEPVDPQEPSWTPLTMSVESIEQHEGDPL